MTYFASPPPHPEIPVAHAAANHIKEQRSTVVAEVVTSYTWSLGDNSMTIYTAGVSYTQKLEAGAVVTYELCSFGSKQYDRQGACTLVKNYLILTDFSG